MECSDEDGIDEIDFAKIVLEYMKKERATLVKAGLDVDSMVRELESLLEKTEDSKARVNDLKRQMLKSLSNPADQQPGAYAAHAEHLDMAKTDLRADDDPVKYFQRLRRRLKRFESDEKDASGREGAN